MGFRRDRAVVFRVEVRGSFLPSNRRLGSALDLDGAHVMINSSGSCNFSQLQEIKVAYFELGVRLPDRQNL